jgi:hypothetical protein
MAITITVSAWYVPRQSNVACCHNCGRDKPLTGDQPVVRLGQHPLQPYRTVCADAWSAKQQPPGLLAPTEKQMLCC